MIVPPDRAVQGRLILVRHGHCGGQGRFMGSGSDVPLDAAGLSQKEELRHWFLELPASDLPGYLLTSPLTRARETAEAFTDAGLVPQVVPTFSEIDLGDWEGLTYEAIMETWPREGRAWFSDPFNNAPPGGEGGRAFQARVGDAYAEAARRLRDGSSVLAVTHAGVIRTLLTMLLEMPFEAQWRLDIQPGRRTTINFQEGVPVVEGINQ